MSVLILVSHDIRAAFERNAALCALDLAFIESASQLTALAHQGKTFSVAILPATLPGTGIWALWAQVQLLNPRPEVLVYARSADYQTWSGVLEAGGHDVLVEPFSAEKLHIAIMKAQLAFEQRLLGGTPDELD
jgi:DNA-binding NtrC family response regulator